MADTLVEESATGPRSGTLSDRYRIVRLLGQGAIGRVYEVIHLRVGRRFAAKLLKPEFCASSTLRERFRREAKVGGKLRSPYAVEVVDYGESEGAPYFVMEYLDGETLQALVARDGQLAVRRAVTLLVHACRGVRAAHALGVLHRDLKPSNLYVVSGERGELCKVLDFGIAKATDSGPTSSAGPETSTGAVIGTLQYMPPEQLRGQRDLDERVDVYALGSILYECLSGTRAFEAPTPSALMYRILEESAERLETLRPGLPPGLVACVERAMARDRDSRTASVAELERQLLPFVAERGDLLGDATSAGTASDVEPQRVPAPPGRRSRFLPVVLTAALAAPLGAVIGYRAGSTLTPADAISSALPVTAEPAASERPEPAQDVAPEKDVPLAPSYPPDPTTVPLPVATSSGAPPIDSEAARTLSSSRQKLDSRIRESRLRTPQAQASATAVTPAATAASPPATTLTGSSDTGSFDRRNPYRTTP
ncbi:MAG TPA: protein kinase [Polyangiaceae bacterium]